MSTISPTTIGARCRVGSHSFVGQGCVLGDDLLIESHSYIGSWTKIASYCEVEYGARIYQRVTVGERTSIGGFICNDAIIGRGCNVQGKLIHARRQPGWEPAPCVHDDAFIGTDAIVIGSVTIGKGAFVTAGAIVTKDVPAGMKVAGAPARVTGQAPRWK